MKERRWEDQNVMEKEGKGRERKNRERIRKTDIWKKVRRKLWRKWNENDRNIRQA